MICSRLVKFYYCIPIRLIYPIYFSNTTLLNFIRRVERVFLSSLNTPNKKKRNNLPFLGIKVQL